MRVCVFVFIIIVVGWLVVCSFFLYLIFSLGVGREGG